MITRTQAVQAAAHLHAAARLGVENVGILPELDEFLQAELGDHVAAMTFAGEVSDELDKIAPTHLDLARSILTEGVQR